MSPAFVCAKMNNQLQKWRSDGLGGQTHMGKWASLVRSNTPPTSVHRGQTQVCVHFRVCVCIALNCNLQMPSHAAITVITTQRLV